MRIGRLIKQYRDRAGIERTEVSRRLSDHGFEIPHQTLKEWEDKPERKDKAEIAWNPDFVSALASIFDKTDLEVLDDLGFNVIPSGFTKEDIEFAKAIREIPNPVKRRRVVQALLQIIDLLEMKP